MRQRQGNRTEVFPLQRTAVTRS